MKAARFLLCLSIVFLSACGVDPEPKALEGEDEAAVVVTSFLRALEQEDFKQAATYLYPKPDYILKDLQHCRDLFFTAKPTGMSVQKTGKELYGRTWQIYVDLKISYGAQMKQLHFTLAPGTPPTLRGVNPIVP